MGGRRRGGGEGRTVPEPGAGAAGDRNRSVVGVQARPRETLLGWGERGAWRAPQTCQRAGRSGIGASASGWRLSVWLLCVTSGPQPAGPRGWEGGYVGGSAGGSFWIPPPVVPVGPGPSARGPLIVFVPRVTLGRERF